MAEAIQPPSPVTRRDFLMKAAAAVAGVAGLSLALQHRFTGTTAIGPKPLDIDEDSLFMPRADQRDRVLGRRP